MHDKELSIPILRVTPHSIVQYNYSIESHERTKKQLENEKNLTRGDYNGYMSPKTKSKVKKRLDTWFNAIKEVNNTKARFSLEKIPYLTFVTLTLPASQEHEDNVIKRKCLTPFIETLKRKYNVWNYFWRAEAQKNGNIHFHIIIDSFIDHKALRSEWNECVNKLDYVDRFFEKYGHRDPNSTDIHALTSVKNVTAYVIKYVSKADGYRPIKGRIHGCSDFLRKLKPYEFIIEVEEAEIIKKAINSCPKAVISGDCFTYIAIPVFKFLKSIGSSRLVEMKAHYMYVAMELYKEKPPELIPKVRSVKLTDRKDLRSKPSIPKCVDEYIQLKLDFEEMGNANAFYNKSKY